MERADSGMERYLNMNVSGFYSGCYDRFDALFFLNVIIA